MSSLDACAACLGVVGEWDGRPLGACWSVCRCAAEYPQQLLELDARTPPVLFGVGERAALSRLRRDATVTIVGSRRATPSGLATARELARLLAAAGLTIVSGMAFGIDSAAHEGALDAAGTTVAILAGGADVPYPATKASLHRRIAAAGLVLSERPPGIRPERWAFPARNRIMAGLSEMTIVVEAAMPSGTLITADEAANLHRNVGALPGPVTARNAAGCHSLIREGAALIRDAQDVLDEMLGVGAVAVTRVGPELDRSLLAALGRLELGHDTVDLLVRAGSGGARECAVALARLELLGYVEGRSDGTFARTPLRSPS